MQPFDDENDASGARMPPKRPSVRAVVAVVVVLVIVIIGVVLHLVGGAPTHGR